MKKNILFGAAIILITIIVIVSLIYISGGEPSQKNKTLIQEENSSGDQSINYSRKPYDSTPKNCAELNCSGNLKCGTKQGSDHIECIFKTCEDHGGEICEGEEYCNGELKGVHVGERLSEKCCFGNCEIEEILSGNFDLSGDIELSGLFLAKLKEENCWGMSGTLSSGEPDISSPRDRILYFNLKNEFEENIPKISYDLYLDGIKLDLEDYSPRFNKLRRLEGLSEHLGLANNYEIPPGNNVVFTEFQESVAGHTIKIVVDPEKEYIQEPVSIETSFPQEKMDIYYDSVRYSKSMDRIFIDIMRDKVLKECSAFATEIYIDGSPYMDAKFFGFNGKEGSVWGPKNLSSGEHTIQIILDSTNTVDESNEENNEITEVIVIP